MSIPIQNIINVSITGTPAGLPAANVNSVAIFTTETPSNIDDFNTYVTASAVQADYGTNSVTAQMASNIFAQSPNILTGDGRLVIIPLINAISAIEGIYESTDITANLTNLQAIADGDIRVVLNGSNVDLTGLNFTNASSLADIATILQRKLTDVIVTAKATGFDLASKKVGASSSIDLVQLPAGSGTDLSVASLFNVAAGTATGGADSQGETISDAILRTEEQVNYTGLITNLDLEDAAIFSIAATVQTRDMIFLAHVCSTEDLEPTTGIASIIKDVTQTKTRILFYSASQELANLMKAAYLGRAFSVNFSGSNTSQTMQLKALVNVLPDTLINQTIFDKAETAGVDYYGSIEGLPVVISNGANKFFDSVYNSIFIKLAVEVAGFNFLKQTNTKRPQTEQTMTAYKAALSQPLIQSVNAGVIAPGTWNGDTFGNQQDFIRNIEDNGYYLYSLPIAQQAQAEREAREAPIVQIAIKEAGAIHSSSIIINIEA